MNELDEWPYGESGETLSDIYRAAEKMLEFNTHMNSAHEGIGLLADAFHDLWIHVKTPGGRRDLMNMRRDAIHLAATAMRFATEVCNDSIGRK